MPRAAHSLQGPLRPAGRRMCPRSPSERVGWGVSGARLSARVGGWLGGLLVLVPGVALACPSCTVAAPESTGGARVLLAALMLVPVLLVGVGVWAARRAKRVDRGDSTGERRA